MVPCERSYVRNTPTNDLFFAINHYMSTGELVGIGCTVDAGEDVIIPLSYDPLNPTDADDWRRLKQRLSEVTTAHSLTQHELSGQAVPRQAVAGLLAEFEAAILMHTGISVTLPHTDTRWEYWLLTLKKADCVALTRELLASSGRAGWGSLYDRIQRSFVGKRIEIGKGHEIRLAHQHSQTAGNKRIAVMAVDLTDAYARTLAKYLPVQPVPVVGDDMTHLLAMDPLQMHRAVRRCEKATQSFKSSMSRGSSIADGLTREPPPDHFWCLTVSHGQALFPVKRLEPQACQ